MDRTRPFYWTDGTGHHEIDFLAPRPDGAIDAFQVGYATGTDVPSRELAAFAALADALPHKRQGKFTLITADLRDRFDDVEAVPMHHWLVQAE